MYARSQTCHLPTSSEVLRIGIVLRNGIVIITGNKIGLFANNDATLILLLTVLFIKKYYTKF
jgi:hypothetical protein